MTKSNWFVAPLFALAVCLTGCGPDTGTTVIEAPQQSEQEIIDADAAYDEQYQQEAEAYEAADAADSAPAQGGGQ